jgi:hypothetical protein
MASLQQEEEQDNDIHYEDCTNAIIIDNNERCSNSIEKVICCTTYSKVPILSFKKYECSKQPAAAYANDDNGNIAAFDTKKCNNHNNNLSELTIGESVMKIQLCIYQNNKHHDQTSSSIHTSNHTAKINMNMEQFTPEAKGINMNNDSYRSGIKEQTIQEISSFMKF